MLNKWLLMGAACLPFGMAQADVSVRQSGVTVEADCLQIKVDGLSIGTSDCRPTRYYRESVKHYDVHHYYHEDERPWKHPGNWKKKAKWKDKPGHWKKREKVTYEEEWVYERKHRH
ncbi:hypothetical protein NTK89_000229 [Vibrio fluvialis]|nr:hypothetical protein [Vibrio fluvialis]